MAKHKKKKPMMVGRWKLPWSGSPPVELRQALSQAEQLLLRGQGLEAVQLLEPLLATYPRVADLHFTLGQARLQAGERWRALDSYEQGLELVDNPVYRLGLASLSLELGLNGFALQAFRQALKQRPDHPMMAEARETLVWLETRVQQLAEHFKLSPAQVEKGVYHLDQGQRALRQGNYTACVAANRQAIKLLPDWLPPYNNLSLGLFFEGQPAAAIATARQALAKDPQNLQALSNLIRFLVWIGQGQEARALWPQLRALRPEDEDGRLKLSEAAAILEEDETVYQLLKPLEASTTGPKTILKPSNHVQLFLAIAEANTGRRGARRRLEKLALTQPGPWISRLLAALKAKKPGPGWATRYPYFHYTDMIPHQGMEAFINLIGYRQSWSSSRFRREMNNFLARYPQIVQVAEKMIWEEEQVDVGMAILESVATPVAYAALRRFGLSQAGNDESRMQALFMLGEAGQIRPDERLQVWKGGRWQEVQVRQQTISNQPPKRLDPQVSKLLSKAEQAFQRNHLQEAERLFQQVLKLDPQSKETYNNLGALYSRRGEVEQAKAMYQAALEIDPNYVFPRCNLVLYLLDEDDLVGAEAMLAPLAEVTHFQPQDILFYTTTQAHLAIRRQDYKGARSLLEAALELGPDYQPARDMMAYLKELTEEDPLSSLREHWRQNNLARRTQLQAKLVYDTAGLAEVLALYPKEVLVGTARAVIPYGGWSSLRKAALVQRLVEVLTEPDSLSWVVERLRDQERTALRQLLAEGGSMAWSAFDTVYGNDLEESPYWQWHTPETPMGRLRERGLLAEATTSGELQVFIPVELRPLLAKALEEKS